MFEQDSQQRTAAQRRMYAKFEIAYTLADFLAAALFIIGSIMFFSESWTYVGTWMFVVGSVLFATKPTLRLAREICLYRMGDFDDLANRSEAIAHRGRKID